jgi:uncharacterized membrane protein YfcA
MDIFLVCLIAFVTAGITGITGVAGGLLPAVFLTPIIGITSVMPVLAIMLLFGSVSRAWINRADFHRDAFRRIAIPAVPMVVLGGIFYAQLEPKMVALMLGSVVLASIPIRRIAKSYEIRTSRSMLSCVGGVFGFLAGSSTGPGLLLVPFMLGYGLSRTSFVATLAGNCRADPYRTRRNIRQHWPNRAGNSNPWADWRCGDNTGKHAW